MAPGEGDTEDDAVAVDVSVREPVGERETYGGTAEGEMDDDAVSEAMEPVALEVAKADAEAAFVVVREPVGRPLAENEPIVDTVADTAVVSLAAAVEVSEGE